MHAKIEAKFVRHEFTDPEKIQFGKDLGNAISAARAVEAEFNTVKAQFKLKTEEAKARIDSLGTKLQSGFEMREKRCRVVYDAPNRKKLYFLEDAPPDAAPVLEEPMTSDDFQQDLIIADSAFENVTEIPLFPPAGDDFGTIVIGRKNDRWFGALRIRIGQRAITEKLDTEQPCTKERPDAVRKAANRAKEWLFDNLGKDALQGFKAGIEEVIRANAEVVEAAA